MGRELFEKNNFTKSRMHKAIKTTICMAMCMCLLLVIGLMTFGNVQVAKADEGQWDDDIIYEPFRLGGVTLDSKSWTYTGEEIKPTVVKVVDENGYEVDEASYEVTYYRNVNTGEGTVYVEGKNNYCDTVSECFTIAPAPISTVTLNKTSYVYSGKECKPLVEVRTANGKQVFSANYNITYSNNVNAGTATVTVTGKNNYKGTIKKTFTITPAALGSFTLNKASYMYSGNACKPLPSVKNLSGGAVYSANFTTTYTNNVKVGTATVTITGKNNYKGKLTKQFAINPSVGFTDTTMMLKQTKSIGAKSSGTIIYSSSNPAVANVSATGVITAVKAGTATITVKSNARSVAIKVTVKNPTLNATTATLYAGEKKQLSVNGGNGTITWKSSNTGVATVSSTGVVTTKKAGTAKITAVRNGITMTCTITVKPVSLSATTLYVQIGCKKQLSVNGGANTAVTWKSSNTSIARVTQAGNVFAVGKGTATITATIAGKNYTCKVITVFPNVEIEPMYDYKDYSGGKWYYSIKYTIRNHTGINVKIADYYMIYYPYEDSAEIQTNLIATDMNNKMLDSSNVLTVANGETKGFYGFSGTEYVYMTYESNTGLFITMNGYRFVVIVDDNGKIVAMDLSKYGN